MEDYSLYLNYLDSLIHDIVANPDTLTRNQLAITQNLDGNAYQELRRVIPVEQLRKYGAFFTSSSLAYQAINPIVHTIDRNSVIFDPACGAGDLLLACSKHLPVTNELESTLEIWGNQLGGRDLFPHFVVVTKVRLTLAAIQRGALPNKNFKPDYSQLFPLITVGDSLEKTRFDKNITHIILNPPYVRVQAPKECKWSNGQVSSAALFLDLYITLADPNTHIIAILPDVLRSGTNYKKWRKLIESLTLEKHIKLFGQFDTWADVDVFNIILEKLSPREKMMVVSQEERWNYYSNEYSNFIRDRFSVHVGRVVEYRDPEEGELYPYVKPRELPQWETVDHSPHTRKFSGVTYESPFVVVRRTSRKAHKYRAVGTLINIPGKVAVENHLLVLLPKNRTIEECELLLRVLHDDKTNEWLNNQILCRHLTVQSVKEIPWWDDPYDNSPD